MRIILNNNSMIPIYEQLVDQVRSAILDGSLTTDTPLPSVRALAAELKISALTVKKAYDTLEADGYVVTVHGKGTYVAAANLQLAAEARRKDVEDSFSAAIAKATVLGMDADEIRGIVSLLLEDL